MKFTKEQLLDFYKKMSTIRAFEEKVVDLYKRQMIYGMLHVYIGEEACAVGICSALQAEDYIVSTHRGHGHCIAKGCDPKKMFAELMGREAGYCHGRGGSMHIADIDSGILGANGIVGAGIPIAVGAALGNSVLRRDRVTVGFFGDGAMNNGAFHEAANLAALWELPVILVCENNLYGMFTPIAAATKNIDLESRAQAYGLKTWQVDGNNVLKVYKAAQEAVETARNGQACFIECKTYRYFGHFVGDPTHYRDNAELEEWKKRDPLLLLEKLMTGDYDFTAKELEEIRNSKAQEMAEIEKEVLASDCPEPKDILKGLYAEEAAVK
jgi:TPP-dependent pyruvate/acetoin dehydrogenase alpha subunit